MTYYYTLAPIANPPESLAARYPNPATVAAWYRYGSYCRDTAPAYIVGAIDDGMFSQDVDLTDTQIITIDPESDVPVSMQALMAVGTYLFDPAADRPAVMEQSIGSSIFAHPAFRLINFSYEDTDEGRSAASTDYKALTEQDLDTGLALSEIQEICWAAVMGAMSK